MAGVITGAVISTVGGLFGANEQANAAENAANTSANASRYASDLQYKMWQEQQALQKPWLEAGQNALTRLTSGLAKGGEFGTPFSQTNWQQDPGYAFRLAEGQRALDRSAAARGGLISGNALKAAERYGQEMGSQEYQNAFNRYYREREAMLNPLQSLAGVGQTTAQSLGGAAQTTGTNIGNYALTGAANQGNALLAGAAGRSSAYQGIGTNLGYALSNQNNWNRLSNWWNSGSSGGGGTGWATSGRTGPVDAASDPGLADFYG